MRIKSRKRLAFQTLYTTLMGFVVNKVVRLQPLRRREQRWIEDDRVPVQRVSVRYRNKETNNKTVTLE